MHGCRIYVYLGGQMLAIQSGGVNWVHQDPVTKSQRVTNGSGAVVSTIDVDPWGGETTISSSQAFQPHRFTSYERDANGGDDAMMRRYAGSWMRFSQPDPYDGSYSLGDPQSFNRYSYVHNDPVNFIDPTGLDECQDADGNIIPCGPDPEIDPSDIRYIYTTALRYSVLPAWMSGHPPTIIKLLEGPRNPVSPQEPLPLRKPLQEPAVRTCEGGQGDLNVQWNPLVLGYTGGVMTNGNNFHHYGGMVIGTPSVPFGASLMVNTKANISPGLNYSISGGAVIGAQWSGKLDPAHPWTSLKNGSLMLGGTTPGFSSSITYVSEPWNLGAPCIQGSENGRRAHV